jgi:hypothetical protein
MRDDLGRPTEIVAGLLLCGVAIAFIHDAVFFDNLGLQYSGLMSVQDFLTSTYFTMGLFVIWLTALLAIYPFANILWRINCLRYVRVIYRERVRRFAIYIGLGYILSVFAFAEYLRQAESSAAPWDMVPIFVELCLAATLAIFVGFMLYRRNRVLFSPQSVRRTTFLFYFLLLGFACLAASANGVTDALEAKNESLLYYEKFNVGLICNLTFDDPSDIIEIERKPDVDVLLPLTPNCAAASKDPRERQDTRCNSGKTSDFDRREKLVRALDKGLLTMRYKASNRSDGVLQFTRFEATNGFHSAALGQPCDCQRRHRWHFDWYAKDDRPAEAERCEGARKRLIEEMSEAENLHFDALRQAE